MTRDVGDELHRRARSRAARELRDLADRIEAGDLPQPGGIVDLARKIERLITKHPSAKKPEEERSIQARSLASMLSKQTGVKVHLLYIAGKGWQGRPNTYTVEWANGPTPHTVRRLAREFAARVPALKVGQLSYSRSHTSRVEVACLLRYLDANPDAARSACHRRSVRGHGLHHNRLDRLAHDVALEVEYPEHIDDETALRVQAVYSLDSNGHGNVSEPTPSAWLRLGDSILAHGWPATRAWLDERAASPDAQRTTGRGREAGDDRGTEADAGL
jgi:hypothetical protein